MKLVSVERLGRLSLIGLALILSTAITGCAPDNEVTAPKIIAGAEHACAFDADREQVICWGDNSYGQLGNEAFSAEGRDAPVRVKVVSGRKIKSLAAGHSHTCALVDGADEDVDTDNTVACWGYNHYGQVGYGDNNDHNIPVFVNGPDGNPLKGVATLTAGAYHTCASMAKGATYEGKTFCWGRNNMGQIGNGSLVHVNVPTEVKGLQYSGSVAAGTAHTCALTAETLEDAQNSKFQIVCWGDASRGQMRDVQVDRGYATEPVNIGLEVEGIQAIYSEHVVQSDVTTTVNKPVDFDPETAVELTTPAYGQTCAITKKEVLCWGGTNSNGQWGTDATDATEHKVTANEIVAGTEIRAFGAGNAQSCMLVGKGDGTDSNHVACWGFSSSLGFPMPEDVTDAVVADNRKAVSMKGGRPTGLAVGREFVCYASKGEQPQIWCWGRGAKGQIGNGTTESTRVPVCVKGYCPDTEASKNLAEGQPFAEAPGAPPIALQVSANFERSCAVVAGGQVYCWGASPGEVQTNDDSGESLGYVASPLAKEVEEFDGAAISIATGNFLTCAIVVGGELQCWGVPQRHASCFLSACKSGLVWPYRSPFVPSGFETGTKAVAIGSELICALGRNDNVLCFRAHDQRMVRGLSSIKAFDMEGFLEAPCGVSLDGKAVTCGSDGMTISISGETYVSVSGSLVKYCMVLTDGRVRCGGLMHQGEEYISGIDNALQVHSGGSQTCVLTKTGGVKCWQTASGAQSAPADVFGLQFGVLSLSVGSRHACAVVIGGVIKCWGDNTYGQLGDGTTDYGYAPVEVSFGGKVRGEPSVKTVDAKEGHSQQKVTVKLSTVDGDLAYGFDCDNDGTYEINGEVAGHECFYDSRASGSYEIGYEVTVKGLFGEVKSLGKVSFTVQNLPPVISSVSHDTGIIPAGSNAAKTFTISSVTASDPGGDALTYAYDCNRDGVITDDEKLGRTNAVCDLSGWAPGTYSLGVYVTDADHESQGNGQTIKPITVTINSPADTQIDSKPPHYSSATTASFTFSSPQTDTIEYKIDSEAFTMTTEGTASFSALTDGTHIFTARAVMGGFADASPAAFTWTVDTVAPITVSDTTFAAPVSTDTVTINFSATDANADGGFTYLCRLDGGSWAPCSSGIEIGPLFEGAHTLDIEASDAAGNPTTSPATVSWEYWAPPSTTLDSSGPAEGTSISSDAASFTFSSGTGTSYECKLDDGEWVTCTSPQNYSGLGDGNHSFSVRAVRNGVPDTETSTRTWTVDTTPPDTVIDAYSTESSGATLNVTFSCNESDCVYACRVDSDSYVFCSSPHTASVSTDGQHSFDVLAYDAAGNADLSPANVTWVATLPAGDTTPPDTTITKGYPNDASFTSFSVEFICDEASCTFECRTDTDTYGSCTSPYTAEVTTEGEHSIDVRAYDAASNVDPSPASVTWTTVFPPSGGGGSPSAVTSVAAGQGHSCVVTGTGELYCWGDNTYGQLGSMMATGDSPSLIGTNTWLKVASDANGKHSCAIDTNENLYCWGFNASNQIGDGSVNIAFEPTQIGTATWLDVATGANHSCGIQTDGTLWCWGDDFQGSTGLNNGGTIATPTQVGLATNWVTLGLGGAQTCAININGELYCWGGNTWGEVGNGSSGTDVFTPTQIGTDTDWVQIDGGYVHTCAVKMNGTLYCWGSNMDGQNGTGADRSVPTQVGTDIDWGFVTAGLSHTCAIKMTGALWCWGANDLGQLGKDTAGATATPAQIGSSTNWLVVGGGRKHSIAIANDAGTDTVYGWGDNSSWQMGDPSVFGEAYSPTVLTLP